MEKANLPNHPHNHHEDLAMESSSSTDVAREFRFFRVYRDGRVEVFNSQCDKVPPSDHPRTGVRSKDVVIPSPTGISARLFLPSLSDPSQKLPLLFYIHGGGFCMRSAFNIDYHNYVSTLVSLSNAIAVSVEYGLFPDRPIPACYEDCWEALQWVASHAGGWGTEPWLVDHADFGRVFIAGDSAGGNISHTMAVRVGTIGFPGVRVVGAVMVHPYFGGTVDDEMWMYMCPTNGGLEDPRMKPAAEDLARLGCERVLVFVAEKDHLRDVGWRYYEELKKSGWKGTVEIVENHGEEHCFHRRDLTTENARALIHRFVSFIKQG